MYCTRLFIQCIARDSSFSIIAYDTKLCHYRIVAHGIESCRIVSVIPIYGHMTSYDIHHISYRSAWHRIVSYCIVSYRICRNHALSGEALSWCAEMFSMEEDGI